MKYMIWTIFLLVGGIVLALGIWLGHREHRWLRQSAMTVGTVVELVTSRGSKGSTTYAPRVSFKGPDGAPHEFTRSYYSSPAGFRVGEAVLVAYDRESFEGRICTFGQRFGTAVAVSITGLCLLLMGLAFLAGPKLFDKFYLEHGAGAPPVAPPITSIR
jgi:hypothetical protein